MLSMHILWVAALLLREECLHLNVQVVPGPCVSVPVPGPCGLPLLLRQRLQHLLLPASGTHPLRVADAFSTLCLPYVKHALVG